MGSLTKTSQAPTNYSPLFHLYFFFHFNLSNYLYGIIIPRREIEVPSNERLSSGFFFFFTPTYYYTSFYY